MAPAALIFLVVALILIGVGIVIGLLAAGLAAALLGVGVVSTSVFVALFRRSSLAGIRAFLLQCGLLAGIPAGVLCAWLARSVIDTYDAGWLVFVYGALGGAISGVVIALLVDAVVRRLHAWAAAKLPLVKREQPAILEV